jgi:hypothetical protein
MLRRLSQCSQQGNMKRGLKYGAAVRVAIRARRLEPRLRLPVTYSQRHADELGTPVAVNYDKEREMILLKLIGAVERQTKRGVTDDNITRIVAGWAGPLAKFVVVDGKSRPKTQVSGFKSSALRLCITNNTVLMELRGRLPALKAALKGTGIEEVKL